MLQAGRFLWRRIPEKKLIQKELRNYYGINNKNSRSTFSFARFIVSSSYTTSAPVIHKKKMANILREILVCIITTTLSLAI